MNILYIYSSNINPILGGVQRVTKVLCDSFRKEGHKVKLIYSKDLTGLELEVDASSIIIGIYPFISGDDETVDIVVYFKDGTSINGYNRTDFTGGKSTLGISKEPKGKIEKYESELIDSIVFPPSANDTTRVVWIPLKAHKQPAGQKNIFSRNEFFKKPVFLMKT